MELNIVYGKILRLYPKAYQKRFALEQEYVFEEYVKEHGNGVQTMLFLTQDTMHGLFHEYALQTKNYIINDSMENSTRQAFLISFFFILTSAVVVGSLTMIQYVFKNMGLLYHLNAPAFILTMLFVFPTVALVISFIGIISSMHNSWKKLLLGDYLTKNLLIILTFVVAGAMLFIYTGMFLFHDSMHCFSRIGNGIGSVERCIANTK